MKKLFFIIFFLTGCNYTGFSEEWKEAYLEECMSEVSEAYCNCSLELIMEKYTSDLAATADLVLMNEDEVIETFQSCN